MSHNYNRSQIDVYHHAVPPRQQNRNQPESMAMTRDQLDYIINQSVRRSIQWLGEQQKAAREAHIQQQQAQMQPQMMASDWQMNAPQYVVMPPNAPQMQPVYPQQEPNYQAGPDMQNMQADWQMDAQQYDHSNGQHNMVQQNQQNWYNHPPPPLPPQLPPQPDVQEHVPDDSQPEPDDSNYIVICEEWYPIVNRTKEDVQMQLMKMLSKENQKLKKSWQTVQDCEKYLSMLFANKLKLPSEKEFSNEFVVHESADFVPVVVAPKYQTVKHRSANYVPVVQKNQNQIVPHKCANYFPMAVVQKNPYQIVPHKSANFEPVVIVQENKNELVRHDAANFEPICENNNFKNANLENRNSSQQDGATREKDPHNNNVPEVEHGTAQQSKSKEEEALEIIVKALPDTFREVSSKLNRKELAPEGLVQEQIDQEALIQEEEAGESEDSKSDATESFAEEAADRNMLEVIVEEESDLEGELLEGNQNPANRNQGTSGRKSKSSKKKKYNGKKQKRELVVRDLKSPEFDAAEMKVLEQDARNRGIKMQVKVRFMFYMQYLERIRRDKSPEEMHMDTEQIIMDIMDSIDAGEKQMSLALCKIALKKFRDKLDSDQEMHYFMILLLEMIEANRYVKYITQDISYLLPDDMDDMRPYYRAVKQQMIRFCAIKRDDYLYRQEKMRNLTTPQFTNVTGIELELANAGGNFYGDLAQYYELPFFLEKKAAYEEEMRNSFDAAHIAILFEVLVLDVLPRHVKILNFDFYYLMLLRDSEKEKRYFQLFTELRFGTEN